MKFFNVLAILLILSACSENTKNESQEDSSEQKVDSTSLKLAYPGESHFKSIRQLTYGGDNAEAYFSYDDKRLVFQSNFGSWGVSCDQIFMMDIQKGALNKPPRLSTGLGRTTCSFFYPDGEHILYGSTHLGGDSCPDAPPFMEGKYVWPIYESYDIFKSDLEGNIVEQLTNEPGYDAEATISPDGSKIVFTSTRSGDLELWIMNIDGTDLYQVTDELGYDGGAFFSPDSKKLVFRASRPESEEDQETYKSLLKRGFVQPTNLEIFTCNIDGSDIKQITNLGKANWAPYFHPSGEKIIFASNHKSESGRQFNLFLTDLDGENVEQITFDNVFDAFPMFSYDGKYLVFSSNRNNGGSRDTNVFIAEWKD